MYHRQATERSRNAQPQPPKGAFYYDPNMMMCSPCQDGMINHCQTVAPPRTGGEGEFDWVMRAPQHMAVPMSTPISECCITETDPVTGKQVTTCDLEAGCGWTAGKYLSDEVSCRFTTEGATYPTLQECVSENRAKPDAPAGTHVAWFPQCRPGEVQGCYYDSVDQCLPSVFGKQRAPSTPSCSAYVCDASQAVEKDGRISFSKSACRCVL